MHAPIVDRPFAPPLDIELDLPPPISVNELRRLDWKSLKRQKRWIKDADAYFLAAKCRSRDPLNGRRMPGHFEITLTLNEKLSNVDLDNSVKLAIDFLRRVELIVDDSKKYMRRVVIEWGHAPTGLRVVLRPREPN